MNPRKIWLAAKALALVGVIAGCGSSSSPTSSGSGGGGGGGGGSLIMSSGDIQPGASYTHVFTTAQVVPYYCKYHGGPGGVGMSGVITVTAGGTPSKHAFSITGMTLPTTSVDVMDTVTWTNNTALVHTVTSDH